MQRKILLLEPGYKNKYPPIGLMKLAAYFRRCGDDVRFYKGDPADLGAELLWEEFYAACGGTASGLAPYYPELCGYIRGKVKEAELPEIPGFRNGKTDETLRLFRRRFKEKLFPKFDFVGVTTLFTFYWRITVKTVNYAKNFLTPDGRMMVGGVAATLLPGKMFEETGIRPHIGLLDRPGAIDEGNPDVIDELPPDYSILEETGYRYPAGGSYIAYTTRGCVRRCPFCAVPALEPEYKPYIGIKEQISYAEKEFGARRNLLLMDNNVLASKDFDKIIDEIKECGFGRGRSLQSQTNTG